MYLNYFGLNEAPFSITPDPAFVYLSWCHRDALAHLLYGIGKGGSGGFVQLTGEVGTGKTTLCRCLLEQIPEGTQIALLLNPLVTPRELLAAISDELGIDISESQHSNRLLVDGLNHYLLTAHTAGERVVVVIDEAQNLSPETLEQVRLLTNLETSKEKLLQIILLGQPELRDLLQRTNLRQLAQRITARYHLLPLGWQDTHLYIRHRMQIAGAPQNPFRRGAMNALYHRSLGIPRLINIIADRALVAAFAQERTVVTAALVHAAADEVQLGERRVRRVRWPWLAAAFSLSVIAIWSVLMFKGIGIPDITAGQEPVSVVLEAEPGQTSKSEAEQPPKSNPVALTSMPETATQLDSSWLDEHQQEVWQGLADIWRDSNSATTIQAACDGGEGQGYSCLRAQGSWSKIRLLGLPVVLVLPGASNARLLLLGMDDDRLLVGVPERQLTITRRAVESRWLGDYFVTWPQASGWPIRVQRGDTGPAVARIMEMADRVDMPYHGGPVFDAAFERWLINFQARNGLQADGIVGRITLLHLMTASIENPRLLQTWE